MSNETVLADLAADAVTIDHLVADLPETSWALPTSAEGWTIAHQIGHLTFVYRIATLAAADPAQFGAMAATIGRRGGFTAVVNATAAEHLAEGPVSLLRRWREARTGVVAALGAVPADSTVPWLVNPLPPAVLAAAGMMEAFAHGQDIADALGVRRPRTDRLRRIVDFVALTWSFGYESFGLTAPELPVGFAVTAPSGEVWHAGPADACGLVTGPAEDLCLLATRRRHRDDLALTADTADAEGWLDIAQCYRGPAGEGRTAGQFAADRAA